MNRHIVRSLQLAVFALALHGSAFARGIVSSIRGVVADASGGVIQGAAVRIEDVTKGWTRSTLSGASGGYEFVQLPPTDEFSIAAEFKGFSKEVRNGIVLRTGQESRIDFALAPGEVSSTVSVEGNISLVQSENASVGSVVDERKVEELPLNGRVFWQLSQLVPNVFPPTQNSTIDFRGGFNVGGNSEVTNNYLIDGIDNSDEATMQPVNRPSVEDIQEFRLLTKRERIPKGSAPVSLFLAHHPPAALEEFQQRVGVFLHRASRRLSRKSRGRLRGLSIARHDGDELGEIQRNFILAARPRGWRRGGLGGGGGGRFGFGHR
jgi:hypothetical protein